MFQFIKNLCTYLFNFLTTLIQVLKSPFQPQPCAECHCTDYNDEEFFSWMKERSLLSTYASDMLAEGIIDAPIKCSRCKHPREKHGNLKQKILTCPMMPNGGAVYVEKLERERLERRRRRFHVKEEEEHRVDTMDLREGHGRIVRQGDQIECHYDVFITSTMEKFESSDRDKPLCFTAGAGDVVPGFERGVVGAKVGSRRRIFVPSSLAYGAQQIRGQRYVDVTFEVEILAVLSN